MSEHRRVTYRLYPNAEQETAMWMHLHAHRELYNAALEQRRRAWDERGLSLSFYDQCRELTALRESHPSFGKLNRMSSEVTLRRVDLAFQHFFRRLSEGRDKVGFPRYKSRDRFPGWGYRQYGNGGGWRILPADKETMEHGHLRLSGIGRVRMRGRPRTPGEPKECSIIRKGEKWYASVSLQCNPERKRGEKEAGLDWGVSTFATLADEDGTTEEVENPRILEKAMDALRTAQKALSRKKPGAHNRKKAKRIVTRLHERVANLRNDFLHKLTSRLVSEHRLIATEALNVQGMTANGGAGKRSLNRAILDTSPGTFLRMLQYKAEEAGLELVEVPTRKVKPTQRCAECWALVQKEMWDRVHECECGHRTGRDENAARVMLRWARGRGPALCGAADGSRVEALSADGAARDPTEWESSTEEQP